MLDTFLVNLSNQLATTFEGAPRVAEAASASISEQERRIPGAFIQAANAQTQTTLAADEKVQKPNSRLGKGGFRHKHVSCDGCLTGIRGMRYKCEVST